MKSKVFKIFSCQDFRSDAYIVGGWIRDLLLSKKTKDLDIAVSSDAEKYAVRLSKAAGGRLVVLDDANRIYRIVLKDDPDLTQVDVSRFKGRNIFEDLSNRDFTVNAMALPLRNALDKSSIIDPFKGRKDLSKKAIRMVSRKVFKADPLRLLRAFRLASELGFQIEPKTIRDIKNSRRLIKKASGERVRYELVRILGNKDTAFWTESLEKSGLLDEIFPEIARMKRSARRFYYHPKGLWQHSIETLKSIERILRDLGKHFPKNAGEVIEHLEENLSADLKRKDFLKLLALFHDCAKPDCASRVGSRMRFLGHEKKGAAILSNILKRTKFSNSEQRISRILIENHMRPISLSQAKILTPRACYRIFREIGENIPELLILAMADWHSYKRLKTHDPKKLKKQEAVLRELMSRYYENEKMESLPKLVDGNVIMKHFRLRPGPVIGRLIEAVREAHAIGRIKDRKQAIALCERQLTRLKKKYRIS
ncbi:MAG: CCA tRNA nucleotidyltransferase [Endomicrobiales bacterium]|nr:CCA tRNA nucleotidyltransferase [Endomicrobiales bacterium]